jgi:hypothetical protein
VTRAERRAAERIVAAASTRVEAVLEGIRR